MSPLEKFNIPGIVRIESGNGGLTKIVVTSPQAAAEIYLHGAHVTHFQPAGQKPVLWMSQSSWFDPAKPIRGGVPICFPWFGPKKDDPKAPAHGFARLRDWEIESVRQQNEGPGTIEVSLILKSDSATRKLCPFDFTLRHKISIGRVLTMTLEVKNDSNQAFSFEEALHTYLAIGDIHHILIEGLSGRTYIDKVDGAKAKEESSAMIEFSGETDRVYQDTQDECTVMDPVLKRAIHISKTGSSDTVVWNPWINKAKAMPDFGDDEWPGMVCVETVNVGKNAIELPPGQIHSMTAKVKIQ